MSNDLANNLVKEITDFGLPKRSIAKRLGISRQAFDRRLKTNSLTTDNLTVIAAMSVTLCGGSVLVDFWRDKTNTLSERERMSNG